MSIRVVIIEDEFYTRRAIRKYVEQIGAPYEVCGEAGNGLEGLEFLRREQPDIALVDITMPVMDGVMMIEAARQENIRTAMIILTGYSEFSYAQAAVRLGVCDYLLKPLRTEELTKGLDRAARTLQAAKGDAALEGLDVRGLLGSLLAEQLLYGGADSVETGVLLEYLDFPANTGVYHVALVQFHGNGPSAAALSREASAAVYAEASRRGLHALADLSDEQSLFLLLNVPARFAMDDVSCFLSGLGSVLHSRVGAQLKLAVSRGEPRLTAIPELRLEAQAIQNMYLFDDEKEVAVYTGVSMPELPGAPDSREIRRQLPALLKAGSEKPLMDFMDACFRQLSQVSANSKAILPLAAEMLSVMIEYRIERGEDAATIHWSRGAYATLFSIDHTEELQQFIRRFALETLRLAPDQGAYARLVRDIRRYVDENYSNAALRLEDIARANAISVQHMCAVYRRATESTIGDYIFEVRMNHARQMIADGHCSVTALAEACGYEDSSYFRKCFRKRFGMTPRQYIEMNS